MSIKQWPVEQQPRAKLLQQGSDALTDAELLAIFLRTGVKGKSAVDLAQELLQQFGSLRNLLQADQAEFCDKPGLGTAKYTQLRAILEMSHRHLNEPMQRGETLTSPEFTINYFKSRLRHYPYEVFAILYLDTRHRIITYEQSLKHNAAAVIFSHNHPSGSPEPSTADWRMTDQLSEALALIDVKVLDHIIIGGGTHCSLVERGWRA